MRQLALVFGVTVYAATTVLASFMGGLALGSWLAGRVAERSPAPLRVFGFVELGVGVSALATHLVLPLIAPALAVLQVWLPDALVAQTLVRVAGSVLVLLLPTTLMGMTLPLMLKAGADGAEQGRRISVLYAANTFGAVLGALLTGYVLVGTLGIGISFRVAACLNVAVGMVALLLARSPKGSVLTPQVAGDGTVSSTAPRLPNVAVVVFMLSGFAALALEVIWFRVLVYFVPATTYAFSTMLASVLLGLATGSYAAGPLLRRADRLAGRLVAVQFATALSVPLFATAIASAYAAGWHTTADIHISVVLAFPPAFLMGVAYPMGLRLWGGAVPAEGPMDAGRVGLLNSANLVGGIGGAMAGGFVVLPLLGTRAGLVAVAGTYLASCLLLVAAQGSSWRRSAAAAVAGALAFGLVGSTVPDLLVVASDRRHGADEEPLWREEGAQTTVAVMARPGGARVLYLDGLHQASDAPDIVQLHRLIGHLPMALHPNPRRAIVVGLGGGVTPGAVSQHDATVDVVELSPSVVGGSRWFSHVNHDVTSQSNVRLRVDDGRNFLLSRAAGYDVITADLIQPEHAGSGNLYSREYFSLMRGALAQGGLALQWIGHRREVEYKLILRTFLDVFPSTTLWADGQLLVGAMAPLTLERADFERKLERPMTRAALEAVGLGSFEALLGLYVAGPEELRRLAGLGLVLTDDRPLVEFFRSLPPDQRNMIDLSGVVGDVAAHVR